MFMPCVAGFSHVVHLASVVPENANGMSPSSHPERTTRITGQIIRNARRHTPNSIPEKVRWLFVVHLGWRYCALPIG